MKKMLALLLTLCLLAGLLPATALAGSVSNCTYGDNCTTHEAAVTVDGTTLHYDTIGEAIRAAAGQNGTGGTVTLLKNANLLAADQVWDGTSTTYSTVIYEDVILDLGGNTLKCNAYVGISVQSGVHFTIKNGTFENIYDNQWATAIEASKSANVGGTGCTITLEEQVTVKAKHSAVYAVGYTTVEVTDSTLEGSYGVFGAGPTNKVTLTRATIDADVYGVYQGPYDPEHFLNKDIAGSEYKISGSEITGDDAGVCINNYLGDVATGNHTLLVENSNITGGTGIETKRTDVIIKGDDTKITATGTTEAMDPNSSPVSSGYALAVTYYSDENVSHDTATGENYAAGTLKIEGGSFTGGIGIQNPKEDETTEAALTITGGTFADDVGGYVQSGMMQDSETGKVVINPATAVAKIGDVGYDTLADAVAAARSGETITLLKEISDQTLIELGTDKDVTIDLNGFNIGFAEGSFFKVKGGKLHLTGRGKVHEQKPYDAPIKIWGSTTDVADYSVVIVDENVTLEGWAGIFITVNPDGSGVNHAFGVKVTVNGSINSVEDTSGDDGHGVYINGMNQDMSGNVPQITLGPTSEITSTGDGIYAAGYAQWNLAGDITAPDALSIKSGTFKITGGTYHSTGEFADPAAANSNGSENTGAALSITSNDDYAKKTVVNVTGGTFISDNSYAVYEGIAKKEDTPAANSSYATISISGGTFQGNTDKGDVKIAEASNKKVVSGGTFSTDLSTEEYEGYLADDVKYQVAHQAGGFSYTETLPAAQELAQSGDTITELNVAQGTTTYTLTLQYNDGATANVTYTVASGTQVPLPTPTRVNYHFDGWSDGTTTYNGNVTYTVTTTVTLTARWTYNGPSSSGGSSTPIYSSTVEKTENGTVTVSPKNASKNTTVTITVKPNAGKELYDLKVTDEDGKAIAVTKVNDTTYTFTMPDGKVTIAATFGCDGGNNCPSKAFTDLGDKQWYHDFIDYAVENGLLEGTSPTTMEPNATLIRAQLAQILYNIEDKPTVTGEMVFEDVPASEWFYNPVLWANQNEIINGTSSTTFEPLEAITRQDLALMLYRYAGKPEVTGDLDGFTDGDQVGDWAEEAMAWAVAEGIVQGDTPTTLNPTGTATRAEAAAMLQRFLENAA